MMTFEDVKKEVEMYREKYGHDICSDAYIDGDDDDVAGYVFMPNDITGYTQEIISFHREEKDIVVSAEDVSGQTGIKTPVPKFRYASVDFF